MWRVGQTKRAKTAIWSYQTGGLEEFTSDQTSQKSNLVLPFEQVETNRIRINPKPDQINRSNPLIKSTDQIRRSDQQTKSADQINRPDQQTKSTDQISRPNQQTRSADQISRSKQQIRSTSIYPNQFDSHQKEARQRNETDHQST